MTTVRTRRQTSLGAWTPANSATCTVNTADPSIAEQNNGWLTASEFEYIELQNNSAQTLDLTNVHLGNAKLHAGRPGYIRLRSHPTES